MSDQTMKLFIAGALLLHGLGHLGALAGTIWHQSAGTQGTWLSDRSWLLPSMPARTATLVAGAFWVVSAVGFVAAALSFWGWLVPADLWRQLAVGSAIISSVGIFLFIGTWPTFNTVAAVGMNIAVLVTQWWTHWPPRAMFGN